MKILKKEILSNGRCHVYFCGIKIASYKKKNHSVPDNFLIKGVNNTIVNRPLSCIGYIYGDNNKVIFGENTAFCGDIYIGLPDTPINNCTVIIGDNTTANGVCIRVCENNTNVSIGKDCMFSSEISLWASDTHTITDMDANVGKNTTIADGCIVGMAAVVSGNFNTENSVIAGNPAKIVKTSVKWDRRRPEQYIKDVL